LGVWGFGFGARFEVEFEEKGDERKKLAVRGKVSGHVGPCVGGKVDYDMEGKGEA
jgi:hypothetical protein